MKEMWQQTINPESVITRVMEQNLNALGGRPRRHMVSIAQTPDGKQFVHIGSNRQVNLYINVDSNIKHKPTVSDIFRLQYDHLPDHLLQEDGVEEVGIDQIRNGVQGGNLIEGVFAVVSRPGTQSILDRDVKGVWAQAEEALGKDWKLVENRL